MRSVVHGERARVRRSERSGKRGVAAVPLNAAILRICNATWRRPVTRCAEAITAFALMIGGIFPLIHLGRPWLAWWLLPYPSERGIWPNYRSPLAWDFFAINTYLIGSLLF